MTYEVKIMTNEQIANTIRDILEVSKELVGIKTWKEVPTTVKKYQGNAFPGMCTQIGEVLATGKTFHTNEEHCFCTGGIVATGVVPPVPEKEKKEMLEVHFAMSKGYKDFDTAMHYEVEMNKLNPPVKEKNSVVQLGLFTDIEDPDLILIFCTPWAADILNRTFCYTVGEPITGFGGNGGCPFLIQYPYVTGKPSFSYSDVAWRKYIGLAKEELTVTMPYKSLLGCIENLSSVAEDYLKYGEIVEE
jgi:uncharacterized protein (DUF169 family)